MCSRLGITLTVVCVSVSHSFGFGLMDASAMVAMARNWTTVPDQHICEIRSLDHNRLSWLHDAVLHLTTFITLRGRTENMGSEQQHCLPLSWETMQALHSSVTVCVWCPFLCASVKEGQNKKWCWGSVHVTAEWINLTKPVLENDAVTVGNAALWLEFQGERER